MIKRLHAFVSGYVQGVFFRATARQWARELELNGFVRNTPDGKVEVVAEGEEEKLLQLLERLKEGPAAADVKDVEVKWEKPTGEFEGFGMQLFFRKLKRVNKPIE